MVSVTDILAGLTSDSVKWKGADIGARLNQIDFWSLPTGTNITVDTTAGDETLPSVTLPNLTGKTIQTAYAMMLTSILRNTHAGQNTINSAQNIQVDMSATGYTNAISLDEFDVFFSGAGQYENILWIGSIDISARTDWNTATDFKWASADSAQDSLIFCGVRTGVRVII